ncbi:MAG: YdbL family protein [Candidatus Abyssubacteria bacterium]
MRKSLYVAVVMGLLFALACVTVNVYFPAAEVQRAADKIVEEVRSEPAASAPEAIDEQSMLRSTLQMIGLLPGEAYAQADINVSTPNIRALKASMKERFEQLRPLYEKGVLGETNDGLVSIQSVEGLSLPEKAKVNKLVNAENEDRTKLYEEIAKANDLPSDTIDDIKKLFANSWRKDAKKGWWIQKDDGTWVKKD